MPPMLNAEKLAYWYLRLNGFMTMDQTVERSGGKDLKAKERFSRSRPTELFSRSFLMHYPLGTLKGWCPQVSETYGRSDSGSEIRRRVLRR